MRLLSKNRHFIALSLFSTSALLLGGLSPANATVDYRTVALSDHEAPGTSAGVTFGNFSSPSINSSGQVAFWSTLEGTSVDGTNETGIWSEGSGSLQLVARQGDQAPGTGNGVVFSGFETPVLNDAGQTAFMSFLTGNHVDFTNNNGVWSEGGGSLGLVARRGDPAPGTPAGTNWGFIDEFPNFNAAGLTVFQAGLVGGGNGIWKHTANSPTPIALSGDAAPGAAPGTTFSSIPADVLVVNRSSQIAFTAILAGSGVDQSNNIGIWIERNNNLSLVVREGQHIAGLPSGSILGQPETPLINDAGTIVFNSGLFDSPQSTTNKSAIIKWKEGTASIVARVGDAAPGTAPGIEFAQATGIKLNGAGQVAFTGRLTGPTVDSTNDKGIWVESGGVLTKFAREGDQAPGTAPNTVFSFLSDPSFNGQGQIAFWATLTDTDGDGTNNIGLWATDPTGVLQLVVRTGDLFDVSEDPLVQDLRVIDSIGLDTFSIGGGEDGMPINFNDAGQLTFRLGFVDGSDGIFVATIPEPAALALVLLGIPMGLRRPNRH